MEGYIHTGPIDCDIDFDASSLRSKTAIVTGGANGIGEAYVRALVAAGTTVCIGDLDVAGGRKLVSEFEGKIHFVQCNTAKWEDQLRLFREAASFSPTGKIHYVVANAGMTRQDDVFLYSSGEEQAQKPDLSIVDVNINGSLYTTKLASHYFIKQNGQTPSTKQEDTCLILIASGAAFVDVPRTPQYCASKWAMRGLMHALRRTTHYYGSRVNVIAPWFIKSKIMPEERFAHIAKSGVEFAEAEDAGQCLLRILSDSKINGHSFFIAARKWASSGYMDLDLDDYPGSALLAEIQYDQMRGAPPSMGLFA